MARFLWICLGGAAGTGARYLLSGWLARTAGPGFPWGTLAVNVLGSFGELRPGARVGVGIPNRLPSVVPAEPEPPNAMRRTSIIFLLLLAMALGLTAGPHPCHAMEEAPKAPVAAGHASCHGGGQPAAPKAPVHGSNDCCDPTKGGHAMCDQACQGAAVLIVAPTIPAALAFQELPVPTLDRPASPFVFPIDHVPLS